MFGFIDTYLLAKDAIGFFGGKKESTAIQSHEGSMWDDLSKVRCFYYSSLKDNKKWYEVIVLAPIPENEKFAEDYERKNGGFESGTWIAINKAEKIDGFDISQFFEKYGPIIQPEEFKYEYLKYSSMNGIPNRKNIEKDFKEVEDLYIQYCSFKGDKEWEKNIYQCGGIIKVLKKMLNDYGQTGLQKGWGDGYVFLSYDQMSLGFERLKKFDKAVSAIDEYFELQKKYKLDFNEKDEEKFVKRRNRCFHKLK